MHPAYPSSPEQQARAGLIAARLDRLPATRYVWSLVVLLSLGAFFEIYELFQTAYVSPGLIRSGIFRPATIPGLWGQSDQAIFAASTFTGLFIGTIAFASVADRLGRRAVFTYSLIAYTVATIVMALQSTALGVDLWRLVAGIGVGVQMVTIDTYISELVPRSVRGRAFALNACIQFSAIPFVALLGVLLVPHDPWGIAGWRFIPLLSAVFGVAVWGIRASLPESPRWLIQHGYLEAAEEMAAKMEAAVEKDLGRKLPAVTEGLPPEKPASGLAAAWRPPFRRRTIMLMVFNFFQTIGFYGFGNWVPAMLATKGFGMLHSLQYSFAIALAYPLSPLLFLRVADKFERKWLIVAAASGIAVFGLLFSIQSSALGLTAFGLLVTASNCLLSFAYHTYQTELFPTSVRAQAVGFCYSWSRLSTVFTSFMVAFFLTNFGTGGVFTFIAASMVVVVIAIGGFGPKTRNRSLEEISH